MIHFSSALLECAHVEVSGARAALRFTLNEEVNKIGKFEYYCVNYFQWKNNNDFMLQGVPKKFAFMRGTRTLKNFFVGTPVSDKILFPNFREKVIVIRIRSVLRAWSVVTIIVEIYLYSCIKAQVHMLKDMLRRQKLFLMKMTTAAMIRIQKTYHLVPEDSLIR